MKSLRAFLLLVVSLVSVPALAQEVVHTTALRPVYMGQQGSIFADQHVMQSDVRVGWKNGVYADLWLSSGFNTRKDFDKEIDLTLGYAKSKKHFSYSVDGSYFVVKDIDVANLNAQIAAKGFFLKAEGYVPRGKGGPGKGFIWSTGMVADDLPLLDRYKRVRVSIGQWVKHDSGTFGMNPGWLYQGKLGVKLLATKKTAIGIGAKWSAPLSTDFSDGRKREFVWEFGLSRILK
jgi:hypothetical protein